MYCKKCSSSIDDDSAFCQKCGEKQEREIINPINKAAHKPEKSPKWVFPITILLYFLCSNITGNIISLIFPGASPELRSAGSTTSLIFAALQNSVVLLQIPCVSLSPNTDRFLFFFGNYQVWQQIISHLRVCTAHLFK